MRAYRIEAPGDVDALRIVERPDPSPGPAEVAIAVRACSLNYRDTIVLRGGYPRNNVYPTIPLSDGAGEVVAVGEGATRFRVGDRVAANFLRDWQGGPITEAALRSSLGGGIDGMLAERVVLPERALVRIPDHLGFPEAATLPCAALTAWNALVSADLKPGETVLLLGTGGVSLFGLQLAKVLGARVILTSGSDAKAARAREFGADVTINYREEPDWDRPVVEANGGRGVDLVLEVGGPGTLERSLKATRPGGSIALIGLLDPGEAQPSILPAMMNAQNVRGIYVGSVAMFEAMNRAIAHHGIRPAIDRAFPFDDAPGAYRYFASQQHVGKVVIEVG